MSNKVIILTGDIQTGKTTLLQNFCNKNNFAAGILTPIVNSKRMFYNITDQSISVMEATAAEEKLLIGKYEFSAAAFAKANELLLNESKRKDIKYLIIDEVGPLEIKFRKGFYSTLVQILSGKFSFTLILVIRQSLLKEAIATLHLELSPVVNITEMKALLDADINRNISK